MNGKRRLFVSLILVSLIMLTGCWDYQDIEETSANIGLALDLGDTETGEVRIEGEKPVINATLQIMDPKQPSSGEGTIDYENTTITGNTLGKMAVEVALFNRGPLIGQHLKITLIGEELAKRMNFRNMLGYLFRGQYVRLSSTILCTKGKAGEFLESEEKSKGNELPALKILSIADNTKYSLRILEPVTYGRAGRFLASNQSFLLPCIAKKNDEIVLEDAAVISGRNKKMIGFMNSEDIAGVNWITGKKGGGVLNVYDEDQAIFAVRIFNMSSKIKPRVDGDKISFDVHVKTGGYLTEDWIEEEDATDPKYLERLEQKAEEKIVHQMRSALYKMQKIYQADVAGFGDALRIHDNKLWQRIKNEWEVKWFADVPIRIKVDLNLRDYGVKAKDE
ncbi:Ger(x)C family spore germination protein [Thermoactinomyces vulgaris]|uniref:Ger(x)C family spore germination protein n=1 Tax=Thermoactinomyces vulgaris TaxID=2026 RepID=UPI00362B62C0